MFCVFQQDSGSSSDSDGDKKDKKKRKKKKEKVYKALWEIGAIFALHCIKQVNSIVYCMFTFFN